MRARRIGERIALLDRDTHRSALERGEQISGAFQQFIASVQIVRQPGAGQHGSLVHPQHVRVDFHGWVPGGELVGVLPVGGRPAVIKQARRGQGEGTGKVCGSANLL